MLKLSNPDIAASRGALGPGDPRISTRAAALGALPQPQEPFPVPLPATAGQERRTLTTASARPAPARPCDVSTRPASASGAVTSRTRRREAAGRPREHAPLAAPPSACVAPAKYRVAVGTRRGAARRWRPAARCRGAAPAGLGRLLAAALLPAGFSSCFPVSL